MSIPERPATGPIPPPPFRVAVAQIEPTLGGLQANLRMHLEQIEAARGMGADLVVFPELSLTGYYLRDQVPEVAEPQGGPLSRAVCEAAGSMAVVFGFVEESRSSRFYNAAAFADEGKVRYVHRKVYLPTYGMFDEQRYFAAGDRNAMIAMAVAKLGQKREALELSAPNVELTWRLGPDEVRQAGAYAQHMLALKQIKRLPEPGFIDTRFVDAMRDA